MEIDQNAAGIAQLVELLSQGVVQQLRGGPGPGLAPDMTGPLRSPDASGPGQLLERLAVAGVELTQSIQYSAMAGGGYGPDNGVPLIARKTLVARAYPIVSPGLLAPNHLAGQRVSGELVVSVGNRVIFRADPTRSDGARLGRQRELDRTLWDEERSVSLVSRGNGIRTTLLSANSPLNFIVPAYYCSPGRASISVRLWTADGAANADWSNDVRFADVQAPRVCLVRVNWTDSSGKKTSPSDSDMLASLSTAERMLPFPYFSTTVLTTQVESTAAFGSIPSSPGACNNAWDRLVADLAVTAIFTSLFGLGDLVIGFVPSAALPTSGVYVAGCGRGGIGAFVGQPVTVAHELGHLYRRNHVAVPGDPSSDVNYPNYGGDVRSIGEVGIDSGTWPPTLYDPASSDDIMSYGLNKWISPYTYQGVYNARELHPAAPAHVARPLLVIAVRMFRNRSVELGRVLQINAPGQVARQWEGGRSPLSVDVLDANSQVLLTHHLLTVPARGCSHGTGCGFGCGGPVPKGREPWEDFDEVIEWPEGAHALSFHDGGEPLLVVGSGEPPQLEVSEPQQANEHIQFRITARHPRVTPSVVVLFTGDDGQNWWPVAFDPPDGEITVAVSSLPAGRQSRFRIVATAQLRSAVLETGLIDLPVVTRKLHMFLPADDCGTTGGQVLLRVRVDLSGYPSPSPHELHWSSSVDGELGTGFDLLTGLSTGTHQLTVSGPDGAGSTMQAHGIIIVSG